ncbi:hypothetical protein LCGC14_2079010 [marine sediment metagenome]|uniref:Uncharacterized protein n=1 Tax=marine sediment metagenome TaxID=412755 RepID=A0A0F9GUJ0_9ZZZZ
MGWRRVHFGDHVGRRRVRRFLLSLVCLSHGGHTFDPDEWGVEYPQVVDDVGPSADVIWLYCGVCSRRLWSSPLEDWPDVENVRAVLAEIDELTEESGDQEA